MDLPGMDSAFDSDQSRPSHNQQVLAKMHTLCLMNRIKSETLDSAFQVLITAMDEAIADAEARKVAIERDGDTNGAQYMDLCRHLARWKRARDLNR